MGTDLFPKRGHIAKNRSVPFSFLLLTTSLLVACASAGGDWELLGETDVNFQLDRGSIDVGRGEERFHEIKIVAKGGLVRISDVWVVFGDGSTFHPRTRTRFEAGRGSRVIDLPGGARVMRRIDVVCRWETENARLTVSVYGR